MPIIDRIADYNDEMIQLRRDIHMHPELGFEEHRTAEIVAEKLKEWGIETHTGIAKTGVVGVIRGQGNGPGSIGLRADLDALPMQENATPPHRSVNDGKMHACGHDGHTAMLLSAARYLSETRNFDGVVNLIFQPAEEGPGGGKVMVEEGLFDKFPCDAVYGMHNFATIPKGVFGIGKGGFMAAADEVTVHIEGTGGHAALPPLAVDPVAIGVQVHTAFQTIMSRNVDPISTAVISVTMFHAGSASNVIPNTATLTASVRTLNQDVRDMIKQRMSDICDGLAAAYGATLKLDYEEGYPALINHPYETDRAVLAAKAVVGEGNVNAEQPPTMGSEDFAYMLEARPGAYILLGQGDENNVHQLHHSHYDFNDEILAIGASYWATLAEQELPLHKGDS
ncbi:MAG: amidohydrolase [Rhodospirillales bacterium]|nr:amidohydrolase [Rhodospirillales bacterium]